MARFWWGQRKDEHRIHWLRWGKLTEVKADGGLGFRELREFNLALLAKQLWRLLTKPNLLVSKIMKARYFKGMSIWDTKASNGDSWCWKSLLSAKELLEEGTRKRVGDGKSINIWADRWLPSSEDGRVKSRRREGMKVQKVSELIRDGRWDRELIKQVFEEEEGKSILRIPLGVQPLKDRIYWNFSPTGMYTVKSGYQFAKKGRRRGSQWKTDAGSSCTKVGTNPSWNFLWV